MAGTEVSAANGYMVGTYDQPPPCRPPPHPTPAPHACRMQDGLELTWAVNVAAPFLLTACLLGAVRERVVVVSSISAASSLDWGNLQQVGSGSV